MMKRKDFYSIALYGNTAWKGAYSAREVIQNASVYYADYVWCLHHNKISETMLFLISQLTTDYANGNTKVIPWLQSLIVEFAKMEVM